MWVKIQSLSSSLSQNPKNYNPFYINIFMFYINTSSCFIKKHVKKILFLISC